MVRIRNNIIITTANIPLFLIKGTRGFFLVVYGKFVRPKGKVGITKKGIKELASWVGIQTEVLKMKKEAAIG